MHLSGTSTTCHTLRVPQHIPPNKQYQSEDEDHVLEGAEVQSIYITWTSLPQPDEAHCCHS